jgi:5,10-methylenetetrahydromethanopterin reductase
MLGSWGLRTIHACLHQVQAIKLGGTANPDVVRWLRGIVGETAEIVVGAVTVVDEDGPAARQLARREVALYLPVVAELDKTLSLDPDLLHSLKQAAANYDFEQAATYISDDLLQKFAFAGTPAQIAAQTAALFEAGVNRVEWGTPHGLTIASGMQLLGEQVLPALSLPRFL